MDQTKSADAGLRKETALERFGLRLAEWSEKQLIPYVPPMR